MNNQGASMTEELNIECANCEQKECHDGYNFCNEAMKENSFYKNKRLYKGIKPNKKLSYAELEKQNKELQEKLDFFLSEKVDGKEYRPKWELEKLQEENEELQKKYLSESYEKAKLVEQVEELQTRLEAQKETIASYDADLNKAKKQIEKMKCCVNCKYCDSFDNPTYCDDCKNKSKWELAE